MHVYVQYMYMYTHGYIYKHVYICIYIVHIHAYFQCTLYSVITSQHKEIVQLTHLWLV